MSSDTSFHLTTNNLSLRRSAIIGGFAILIMTFAALFSVGFVLGSLIVEGNINLTISNIKSSEQLFRFGIFSWIIIFICDLLVSWSLYVFFKPLNPSLSLLTACFRIVYTTILGISISHLITVAWIINTESISSENILLHLERFQQIWSLGLIIFGAHLFGLGYLSFQVQAIPRLLGILLILAALGYFINNTAKFLIFNYEQYQSTVELIFMLPMILGEIGLAIWLLRKGGKLK